MKKSLAVAFVCTYLSVLSFGIFAHALSFMQGSHPAMYFIVWDMFCGWSAYSQRFHVIAEGESGEWYEAAPGPWGSFQPFGTLDRRHYDSFSAHLPNLAMNNLRHTAHEPITRVFVVEENWAKKYNMPEDVWQRQYGTVKPRDEQITRYHRVRRVHSGDGSPLHSYTPWHEYQVRVLVADNPRLISDMRRGKSFYAPPARWMPSVQESLAEGSAKEFTARPNAN